MFANFDIKKSTGLIVGSLLLGVAGNWIYAQAFDKQARLELSKRESTQAGQTTIDLKITNAGSFDLIGIQAAFALERGATLSITPDELKKFATLRDINFKLQAPDSF